MNFEIKDDFYIDKKKIKIIAGAVHYYRIVPEYWRDRLEKLKAMGCNTVETYVPWNMHEPKKGEFCFVGMMDIGRYMEIAQELELLVILRPAPYICAEWEFGGLPAWLLKDDAMRVRSMYKPYIQHVDDYYKKLFSIVAPYQVNHGGPIIMMQIENEYGYYSNEKKYLHELGNIMRKYGAVVPFVTSDSTMDARLKAGSVPDIALPTCNCGSGIKERFEPLRELVGNGPIMCMEFWIGWFDVWDDVHHTRDVESACKELKDILDEGHVCFYMLHGGTNFGFMNGANFYEKQNGELLELEYDAATTSYDYDAPITECGDLSPKYHQFKEVIANYTEIEDVKFSTKIEKKAYGKVKVEEKVALFNVIDELSEKVYLDYPVPMEKLDQNYGYILYRSNLGEERFVEEFRFFDTNDRAQVFINEEYKFAKYKKSFAKQEAFELTKEDDNMLDILVENMGRTNFGETLNKQRKGITGGVIIDKYQQTGWDHYTLPLDNLEKVDYSKDYKEGVPAFYKFNFEVTEKGDTFLSMNGWGKGCAFINGFNLGRFWEAGPTDTLYIPAPLLKEGMNEIVVFETEGKSHGTVQLLDRPNLG